MTTCKDHIMCFEKVRFSEKNTHENILAFTIFSWRILNHLFLPFQQQIAITYDRQRSGDVVLVVHCIFAKTTKIFGNLFIYCGV